ncbi:ATP-dependent DNA helicase RecG [Brachybacterium muris]|uniref:ATP-dependent DNA helicase RecG n=1 Tax=Brachybacterium muris TaxID=219301 RepID=UPI00223A784B|nr:ATP-dependent DNA helicase RecG [Brachybacterium muris]MCT2260831.1 ATP-dependent DNA helicase RecG [Brachybacterium muris]
MSSRRKLPPLTPQLAEILAGKEATAMKQLGLLDLDTMLRQAPRRYVTPAPLEQLRNVHVGMEVSAEVRVVSVKERRMRSRHGTILEARVTDDTDDIPLTFFLYNPGQVAWHRRSLVPGKLLMVWGTVGWDKMGDRPQITHPQYEEFEDTDAGRIRARRPRPVYPLRKNIALATVRSAMRKALDHVENLEQPVPRELLDSRGIDRLPEAMRLLHQPLTWEDVDRGKRHLVYEEAFVLQTIFAQRRVADARTPAPALRAEGPLQPAFDQRLPFELTEGQQYVGQEIIERLERDHPTSVLLQGDVGSGKTVIALRAMLRAVDSGHQAALLAPTEVLAEQHHRTITDLLGDLSRAGQLDGHADATRVRLLTGSQRTAERRCTLLDVTSGEAGIVIGTHALLTESVEFASLGLVVIDEQHRFGVDHRRQLRTKGPGGASPHMVVMTATPIPRTAALATMGDLDVVTLRDRPGMRACVESFVVHEDLPKWEQRMWQRAGEEVAAGRQVFVVCARIDETGTGGADTAEGTTPDPGPGDEAGADGGDTAGAGGAGPEGVLFDPDVGPEEAQLPARGVTETARRLASRPELAGARIAVLHGRLSSEEKQAVMARVVAGEVDVLVATTVIEVGVDVPNASVMIVLDAERFGVSQLHQLRGRVGRGTHPGIAFLDTRAVPGSETSQRLEQIAGAADGFALAELDLQHRGAGDLVGDEQSGLGRTLRYLDVLRDVDAIEQARKDARTVVDVDPDLLTHPDLVAAIERRLQDADPDVERS